ncbi:TetR/AcrR family transcriptional regulator [Gordonia phthalatica]|uniref:TetR/AcrR family transcriptional regulator n=1 Tax=Gordonia phthalatica TaxID=1136941 RepID=UPI000AAAAA36|nr:TetR/AcrR family transcriptional regulator [Gordonia phthalatica]
MSGTGVTRTRPANRRELIVDAATILYADRGYENVAMSHVADAVGVRPSALYRHFANKESLLGEVFARYVQALCDALDATTLDGGRFDGVIDVVLARRQAGRLWIRESRFLPHDVVGPIRETLLSRVDRILDGSTGPGVRVRSTAVLGALFSVSTHSTTAAHPPMRDLMVDLVERAATGPVAAPSSERPSGTGLPRITKRELILSAAVDLFARRTYDGVAMDDIAAAADLASSSLYNHFASKGEILATALHRGNGFIQISLDDALAVAASPEDALRGAAAGYATFAVRHPALVQAIVSEVAELPEPDRGVLFDAQRGYVDEWVHLCEHLDADPAARRVVVLAAIAAVNALANSDAVGPTDMEFVADYAYRILGLDAD